MKGDFSRLTFDPANQFTSVLMQQGRVQLDADWNEQAAILLHSLRTLTADLLGPLGAGPQGHVGFHVQPSADRKKLGIGPGRYYVGGLLCENARDAEHTVEFPQFPFLVYLDVWERHLTHLQHDGIREVALGGPDTATRAQVVWRVRVTDQEDQLRVNGEILSPGSIARLWPQWVNTRYSPERGKLKARTKETGEPTDPCLAAPDARYRGAENQLYRLEVHSQEPGPAISSSAVTLKWSRENGSVVFAVRGIEGRAVFLESLGRDDAGGLKQGDWVELVNDESELGGLPGPLMKVVEIDQRRLSVTLAPQDESDPNLPGKPGAHALLRRWDHQASPPSKNGRKAQGAVLFEFASGSSEQKWLDLEDGIQIQLQAGIYRPGDYWLIPARTATGDVEWPQEPAPTKDDPERMGPKALGPHGVEHYYAPLALVDGTAPTDLRRQIAPLTIPIPP